MHRGDWGCLCPEWDIISHTSAITSFPLSQRDAAMLTVTEEEIFFTVTHKSFMCLYRWWSVRIKHVQQWPRLCKDTDVETADAEVCGFTQSERKNEIMKGTNLFSFLLTGEIDTRVTRLFLFSYHQVVPIRRPGSTWVGGIGGNFIKADQQNANTDD